MPIAYECEICKATSQSVEGWFIVSVQFVHEDTSMGPPGGRMLDSTAPDLFFDKLECRDKWCKDADVPSPPAPVV